jgi:transcriptional regulator GlxA family with amidase domain
VREARWVEDGKFVTSSGVSAGIDMTLAVIARLLGNEMAERAATGMEYEWHRDAGRDPFAKVWGLV